MIKTGFKTHRGMRKKVNEDACFVMTRECIYMVADGVSGESGDSGGQCASHTAVSFIAEKAREKSFDHDARPFEIISFLRELVEAANAKVISEGKASNKAYMYTTLVIGTIIKGTLYVGNVGDSRAYIIRGDSIRPITKDHTYVAELVHRGIITEEEARNHPKNNEITRALGVNEKTGVDFYEEELMKNDVILFCSDGLYKEVENEEIIRIINREKDMNHVAKRLINRANCNGGSDNIAAICVKWEGESDNE